ncbi:MAG: chorismate mutase, partial [Candidatus Omnitrophota bacterium]|nr:chorismate mutase [Candidatus Omnitrophota bacterium]
MSKLTGPRKKINEIDKKIIALLNGRAGVAKYIGKLKKDAGVSIYTPEREVEIYENIIKENKGPLPNKALFAIYREIMSGSLGLEKKLKIAYLGPEATFTHQAGIKKFGSNVEYYTCPTITDVFRDVEAGRSDYGVVPVENSTEGMINHTLDMFINSDLKICSEIMLEISHNLLGKCGMKSVKKIYSKQEVFGQCRLWLEINMRGIALAEVSSTSKAAEIASGEKNSAAIASMLAAKKY